MRVGGPHSQAVGRLGGVIEHRCGLQVGARKAEGANITGQQRKRQAVTRIRISAGEGSHNCSDGLLLLDARGSQFEAGGGFVGIQHRDREDLFEGQAARVGRADRHAVGRLRFKVEGGIRLQPGPDNLEGRGVSGNQGIAEAVARVGVGTAEGADGRTNRQVLGDGVTRQGDVGRGLVGIHDGDGEDLVAGQAPGVGRTDRDAVRRLRFEVEGGVRLQFGPHDLEVGGVSSDQRVAEAVTRIGIAAAEVPHDCARHEILDDGVSRERDVGRGFVGIEHRDGERLVERESARVRDPNGHTIAGLGLEIVTGVCLERVAGNREGGHITGNQRIAEGLAGVRIGGREDAN